MWGDIYGWTKYILSLGDLTRRNRADIEEMREQIERLSEQVRELTWKEQQRERDESVHRQNLLLQLEIQLLKFERRLPPPAPGTPPPPSLDKD